jgi:hypothetical protein
MTPGLMYFSPYHPDPGRVPRVPAPSDPDDPQKGQWGGRAVRPARELRARVAPADPGWFEVTLEIVSTNPVSPLEGWARFHLHPTFSYSQPEVAVRQGKATLSLRAWGAFTVGAEADDGQTRLELDLSELKDAPQEFRDR